VQPRRGAAEAQLLGHRHELSELTQFEHGDLYHVSQGNKNSIGDITMID
jgi:hypothetical protein